METDQDKIDNAAIALLSLTLDSHGRAWKQLDFEITNSLYQKGFICDPVNKNKSIVFTEEGIAKAEQMIKLLFSKG
jgi:hypothetical protein